MEKRSRRRTRDLVTQPASQGLSQNENGCARISMIARSMNAPFTGRIQKRKTNHLYPSHLACNTRPVHTDGSFATDAGSPTNPVASALGRKRRHFIGEAKRREAPTTEARALHSITSSAIAMSLSGI